jgi:diacylglycerol kinase family enzyme
VRIAILHNPRAGRGRGSALAAQFDAAATRDGHEVRALDVTSSKVSGPIIEWSQALAIVGGDGTLHHALPDLLVHPRPIYHAAIGTENLFAREFAHVPSPVPFLRALRHHTTRRIDLAELSIPGSIARPVPFSIMASLGPDASIVHRLAARRTGPIHHLSYLRPSLAELTTPRIPTLTISVDGKALVEGRPGMALIANMRHYAVRLNPASRADPADGELDVLFLPGQSLPVIALSMVAWRMGVRSGALWMRGRHIDFEATDAILPQADGEAISTQRDSVLGASTPSDSKLVAQVLPMALEVFVL